MSVLIVFACTKVWRLIHPVGSAKVAERNPIFFAGSMIPLKTIMSKGMQPAPPGHRVCGEL